MTNSLWVIRDRDSGQFWNGFGYTRNLSEAHLFEERPPEITEWVPFAYDVLELRLIERESDVFGHHSAD